MAAITRVYTLRRAAFILGRSEDLLWDLADSLEPEDGVLWIHDLDDDGAVMGFTDFGLDNMRELIADQIDRKQPS
jgi:hypothetical protein